ncbi:uncharacterized protein I206_100010 [Kwoniella pini CBS 10737]|uniref:DUF6534 domain-containing protein n=1 Tax=Kwoniella pini CBS 10737 TaxID=1296096 RepID=A0A1B9HS98_9TREE|nr:uncharacterized protein I206_07825 [Kwoniella pini CBS 10737]OCF46155.1 hypothetical protein I206_07825 [Kwoniella pini CBS 10737]
MEEIAKSNNPYPVMPTGYLLGSYLALALYGVHFSQVVRYFSRHRDSWKIRLLVVWIFILSTLQIIIILLSSHQYFVNGIETPSIWGTFWWLLSFQDGLIPLMAFTAQLYFGRRAWKLTGRRPWMLWLVSILATITLIAGIALAVTAHIWSDYPFVSKEAFKQRVIGIPSQVVAITWMGLSAVTDGSITLLLVWRFRQARNSVVQSTRSLVKRMVALTLETVLLTHLVGGIMCIMFIASPAAHRTKNNVFWVLLESVTELYALSVVFTINSRTPIDLPTPDSLESGLEVKDDRAQLPDHLGQTILDYHVEGYQGSTPFGVRAIYMPENNQINSIEGGGHSSRIGSDSAQSGSCSSKTGSSGSGSELSSPVTPLDELAYFTAYSPRRLSHFGLGSPETIDEDMEMNEKS